jgi:hypothetical protein
VAGDGAGAAAGAAGDRFPAFRYGEGETPNASRDSANRNARCRRGPPTIQTKLGKLAFGSRLRTFGGLRSRLRAFGALSPVAEIPLRSPTLRRPRLLAHPPLARPRDVAAPRSRPSSACDGTVSCLTVSLLIELSDKVNEPGGDGLRKVVLCLEISPDGRWDLTQLSVVPHRSSVRRRSANLVGNRDYPSADQIVQFVCRTEPAFSQSE